MLDGDAFETTKKTYGLLNQGRLRDKIRIVEIPKDEMDLDPSKIFQLWGRKGIMRFLKTAKRLI